MNTNTTKKHKFFALFSVVRVYNIILLTIAQYLAVIFVFAVNKPLKEVLFDCALHLVVIATIGVVSAGYIINDFYDASIDAINKPIKTKVGNWVSQKTKLQVYFLLNFISFILGLTISWRAGCFFGGYIFLIWFYSHKLQHYPVIRVLSVTILDLLPFFVIFVFYNHVSWLILTHGMYLYLVVLLKEIIKDFKRSRGAILNNRETLVLKYGVLRIKIGFALFFLMLLFPVYFILQFPEIGLMKYYFYLIVFWGPLLLFLLMKANKNKDYHLLHNFLRGILVLGLFSLSLIDTSVLIVRILNEVKI